MEVLPSTTKGNPNSAGFWFKKQGILGWAIIAAIGYGILKVWADVLAFIIPILQNTIYACILGGIILGVGMFLAQPRVRASIGFLFQHFCTWVTSWVTDVYPLEVIRSYIKELQQSANEINVAMVKLAGGIQSLSKTVNDNKKQIDEELGLARQFRSQAEATNDANKKQEKYAQMTIHTNSAQYLTDSNTEYEPILANQRTLYSTLEKVHNAALYKIQDKTNQTDQLEIRWKTSKASSSAIASAKKIFNGTPLGDMATESLKKMEETMALEAGAYSNFMTDIKGTLETIDAKNGMMTAKGLELLDKVNSETDFNFLLNNDKSANAPQVIMVPASKGGSNDSGLANLI